MPAPPQHQQPYPGPALPTPDHIRLLSLSPGHRDDDIHCSLRIASLDPAPAYEALSYTWGDQADLRTIYITSAADVDADVNTPGASAGSVPALSRETGETGEISKISGTGETGETGETRDISKINETTTPPVPLRVTANCFLALRRLRLPDRPRVLWIDALCIDQASVAERNHQVTLMAAIYSRADGVAVYVGEKSPLPTQTSPTSPPTNNDNDSSPHDADTETSADTNADTDANLTSDDALDFIAHCDDPRPDAKPRFYDPAEDSDEWGPDKHTRRYALRHPKSPALVRALTAFFARPWFARVWVVQEIAAARRATLYCGDRALDWDALRQFHTWNVTNRWLAGVPFVVGAPRRAADGVVNVNPNKSLKNVTAEYGMLKTLVGARGCRATDPRDKVYGLLALFGFGEMRRPLVPDYGESLAKVYTDCARTLIAGCGIDVVCAVQGGSRIDGLPSWVPDWSVPPRRCILNATRSRWPVWGDLGESYTNNSEQDEQTTRPPDPEVVCLEPADSNRADAPPTPALRVHGVARGRVTRVSSVFHADKGPFPHAEWRALVHDPAVLSMADRVSEHLSDPADAAKRFFYGTLSCEGGSYSDGLIGFVMDEHELETGEPGTYARLGLNAARGSWRRQVREVGRELAAIRGEEWDEEQEVPFDDIPFHRVGKHMAPSLAWYARNVVRCCHGRRFAITDTGCMAIVDDAEVGDWMCLFNRADTGLVLREVESEDGRGQGRWRLVGECSMERMARTAVVEGRAVVQRFDIV